jgi:type I restriction enzyme S subunit
VICRTPFGWREVSIADLGHVVTGATPRAADTDSWGDAVDFITPGDQRPGSRDTVAARRLSAAGAARLASRLLPAGSTCVTCIGATIGKTSFTARPAVTNQQINSVVPDESLVTPAYLYYLLTACAPRIARASSGSAAQILNKAQFERLPVRIPPFAEQERATAVLGALDDKIAANGRTAATALALADALFEQALFEQALFEKALFEKTLFEEATAPGRAVSERPLGDLVELRYGRALPAGRRRPGGVPVYGSGGVVGSHDEALVAGPGIIIGRKGTAGAVHWSQRDFFPIDTVFYVLPLAVDVPLECLFFAIRRLRLTTMRSDSAVPGLTRSSVLTSTIRLPRRSATRDFQRTARDLLATREALGEQAAKLATLRDELLVTLMAPAIAVCTASLGVSTVAPAPLTVRGLH